MKSLRHFGTHWILLLCLAFLAMRVAGIHVHLCFDGGEPPASVHLGDAGLHGQHDQQNAAHSDVDINPISESLTKTFQTDWNLPVLLAACLSLLTLPRPARVPLPRFRSPGYAGPLYFLRPPLRGPPA